MDRKGFVGAAKTSALILTAILAASMFTFYVLPVLAGDTVLWTTDAAGNDQYDFAPGDIVYIHGTGFDSDSTISIDITRPDSAVESCISESECNARFLDGLQTSDAEGDVLYRYDLDGIVGEYMIDVSDGTNDASTTFTDARNIDSVTLDGGSSVSVAPSTSITAAVTVTTSPNAPGSENDWESTAYLIEGGSWICVNTPDHTIGATTSTESFSITAPASPGVYDVSFRAYQEGSNCGGTGSNTYTLTDGITVTSPDVCGNGNQVPPEVCDDGNTASCDGCNSDCSRVDNVCGDGIVECGETCDDGNTDDGDGCDSSCTVESGWECTGQPSECTVTNPTLPNSCGIDMVLIIDSSGSISGTELTQMKDAFKDFVDAFLPNTPTQIAVVDFDNIATLTQDYTSDIDDIKSAIDSALSGGYTNWEDALEEAHDQFDNRAAKPDLYVFASDGNPNRYGDGPTSASESEAVAEAVEDADAIKLDGIRIITLGIGDDLDADNLKAISSNDAYYSSGFDTLADTLADIAGELCGGTITVMKYVDDVPASGWHFDLTGATSTSDPSNGDTDGDGYVVFDIEIPDDPVTVDLTETLQGGFGFVSASCNDGTSTQGTNSVTGITVGKNDAIYCEFENTEYGCVDDDDCDGYDRDYCDGDSLKHDEGVCNNDHQCEPQTTSSTDCYSYDLFCEGTTVRELVGYCDDNVPECSHHDNFVENCLDDSWCNGQETCSAGSCVPGTPINCDDSVGCTVDICNEGTDQCDNTPTDALCDDGQYCNGDEWCHPVNDCQPGNPIDCSSLNGQCQVGVCDEGLDSCQPDYTNFPLSTPCGNGLWCDGPEHCDGVGSCVSLGQPVNCDDQNPCTEDVCDEENDECDNTFNDDTGPITSNVVVDPAFNNGQFDVTGTAGDECSNIQISEYFLGHQGIGWCGLPFTGTHIYPEDDGSFDLDKKIEYLAKDNVEYYRDGLNWICIQSKDTQANWGNCECAYFETDTVPPDCPYDIYLDDEPYPDEYLICGDDAWLNATVCDSQSKIQGGEYFIDTAIPPIPEPWSGIWMDVLEEFVRGDGYHCAVIGENVDTDNLEDGTHYIKLRGKDTVENWGKISECSTVSFIRDTTPPEVKKELLPADDEMVQCYDDEYLQTQETLTDGCYYVKQGTQVHLTSFDPDPQETDEFAGDVIIHWRVWYKEYPADPWVIDQEGQSAPDGDVVITLDKDSYHLIEYWAVDACGWESEHHFELDIVDTQPPEGEKIIGTPFISCVENPEYCEGYEPFDGWVRDHVTEITLDCTDQLPHPVDDVTMCYRISFDGQTPWLTRDYCAQFDGIYTGGEGIEGWCCVDEYDASGYPQLPYTFTFQEDSLHDLEYYCIDALGNENYVDLEYFRVDSAEPETTKTYGDPHYPDGINEGAPYPHWITTSTPITLTAVDQAEPCAIGVDKTWYIDYLVPDYFCEPSEPGAPDNCIPWCQNPYDNPMTAQCIQGIQEYCEENWDPQYESWADCVEYLAFQQAECEFDCDYEGRMQWYLYTEPFTKDEESCHMLQYFSVDHLGNVEQMEWQCVYVEDTPPTIYKDIAWDMHECTNDEWMFYGEPDYGCHFITQDTLIYLDCVDEGDHPVDDVTLYWRDYLIGDTPPAYTEVPGGYDVIQKDEDSEHILEFYCVDALGNSQGTAEEPHVEIDIVDTKPPETVKTVSEPKVAGDGNPIHYYITDETEIELTCTDQDPHPVDHVTLYWDIYWSYDCTEPTWDHISGGTSDGYALITGLGDSCHKLVYWCSDILGNTESEHVEIDAVDNTPPSLIKTIEGPRYGDCPPESESDVCFIDGITVIHVESTDPEPHPVDQVTCDWDYTVTGGEKLGEGQTGVTPPFDINFPEESTHTLTITCSDSLGNSVTDTEVFHVDKTPPTTTKTYGEPFFTDEVSEWITSQTQITLTVDDTGPHKSGIKETKYRVTMVDDSYCEDQQVCQGAEGSGEWSTYADGQPFQIGEQSCHIIEYYSVDNVEKPEDVKWQCVFVDDTEPEGIKTVGEPKIPCSEFQDDSCDYWVRDHYTEITLDCIDPQPHPVDHEEACFRVSFDYVEYEPGYYDWGYITEQYCPEGQMEDGWCCVDVSGEADYTIIFQEDSLHNLEYYCEDALGNQNEVDIEYFRVDSTPPVTEKIVGQPTYPASQADIDLFGLQGDDITNFWIRDPSTLPGTLISLDATDYADPCAIGVEEIHYRICLDGNEDNQFAEEECEPWVIVPGAHTEFTIDEDCLHKIEWFAVDLLGNTEQIHVQYHRVDSTPPESTKEIGDPKWWDESLDLWWVTSDTQFTLTAVDEAEPCAVGIAGFHVKIEWDSDCDGTVDTVMFNQDIPEPFEYTFTLNEECLHKITWYAYDLLGNQEEPKEQLHKVDNTPPHVLILKPTDGWYSDGEDIPIVAIAEDLNSPFNPCEGGICQGECDGLGKECAVGIEDGAQCHAYLLDVLPEPMIVELETEGTFMYNAEAHECQGYATIPEESGIPDGVVILVVRAEDNLGNEAGSLAEILRAVFQGCGCDVYDLCMPQCVDDVMQDIITIWNLPKIGIDNHAPVVTITAPEDGDLFGGEQVYFEADVDDMGDGVSATITTGTPCYITVGGVSLGTVPYDNMDRKCSGTIMIPEDEDFPQGTQPFRVEIADNAGNLGYDSVDVEVDTVRPEVEITNPAPNTFVKGTVSIDIYVDDENVDESYLEGNLWVSKDHGNSWFLPDECHSSESYECTYSWDTTMETEGMIFGLKAKVTDLADNTGESEVVVVIVDNQGADILAIVDPYEGEIVSGTTKLEAVASDFVSGIERVEFYIDDDYVGEDTNPLQGWKMAWDSESVDDGEHEIYAMAFDNVGHQRTSQMVSFIVDNDDPYGPDYIYHMPDEGVDYGYSNDDHVTWVWMPAEDDGSGVDYYRLRVCFDGEECMTTKIADGGEIDAMFFTVADLPDGCYEATVQAFDKAGHEGDWSEEDYLCIDTVPPTALAIGSEEASPGYNDDKGIYYDDDGEFDVTWLGGEDDNFGAYVLYRNGASYKTFAEGTYTWDEDVADGTYTYRIVSIDEAGWETSSEEMTVVVDSKDPDIEVTVTPGVMGMWAFTYVVSDPEPSSGIDRIEVTDTDATPFCSLGISGGWCMVLGGTFVELTVYDMAGNSDTDSTEGAPADTTAPMIIYTSPSGVIFYNDITLEVETNEPALCYYSEDDDLMEMESFGESGYMTGHSAELGILQDGLYVYHVQCKDMSENWMEHSKTIVFYVSTAGDWCYVKDLNAGWNSFFLPKFVLDDINFNCGQEPYEPEDVLASLYSEPDYSIVWYYDEELGWLCFDPELPQYSSLTEFNDEVSNPYFIKMKVAGRIELACEEECEGFCGDGSVNQEWEQCDYGQDNGVPCEPEYGDSCEYCSSGCTLETVTGGYCGDGTIQQGYETCETDNDCCEEDICVDCLCTPEYTDYDEDGYMSDVDCDDSNYNVNPGAEEVCNNEIDDDCDGYTDCDDSDCVGGLYCEAPPN